MRLLTLLAAVPFCFSLACATVAAEERPAARSAGNVTVSLLLEDVTAAQIDALRAQGPAGLAIALKRHDEGRGSTMRMQWAAIADQVAGQRYSTESRLFWYQDLDAAKAQAKATGKPILSLRMLGRLDEDLSCANSRFFRTTLYPDAAVGKLLREKFILHWSSERNAPRVTVDFGDGRKLESTVTGNSAHYVLDAEGRPLDVLPGLYAPQVFVRELEVAAALHASLRNLDDHQRAVRVLGDHHGAMDLAGQRWDALPSVPMIVGARGLLTSGAVAGAAAAAQRATMSKAYVEVPMLKTVDLGTDPGKLPDDIELWAEIGQQMLAVGAPPDAKAVAAAGVGPMGMGIVMPQEVEAARKLGKGKPSAARPILDARALTLVNRLLLEPRDGVQIDDATRLAVLARLEQTIVADTALNEVRLRPMIRSHLMQAWNAGNVTFESVNTYVYASVFHAPATDAWMGLLPRDTFTGLPGGAVISQR